MTDLDQMQIAFVGLGEAAEALIGGWGAPRSDQITGFDIKSTRTATRPEIAARCDRLRITEADSLAAAVASADLVFSTVTADQAVQVARDAAPHLKARAFWCDLNSCAPTSKQAAAEAVHGAGGRYVDVAVMAPVYPKRHRVPVLLSGEYTAQVAPLLEVLSMSYGVVDGPVGRASAIKMVRSIFVKGMEALTAECTLAAAAAGVTEDVLPSLLSGHPRIDVAAHASYNFERSLQHGARRAAEMVEVAKMLADLGLPAEMSEGAVAWQDRIAATGLTSDTPVPLEEQTRAILAALQVTPGSGD